MKGEEFLDYQSTCTGGVCSGEFVLQMSRCYDIQKDPGDISLAFTFIIALYAYVTAICRLFLCLLLNYAVSQHRDNMV